MAILGASILMLGATLPLKAADVISDYVLVPTALQATTNVLIQTNTGTAYTIKQPNTGLTLWATDVAVQGSNTAVAIHGWDFSPDNVTWTTGGFLKGSNTLTGTTAVTGAFTFTSDQIRGMKYVRAGFYNCVSATTVLWTNSPTDAVGATNRGLVSWTY